MPRLFGTDGVRGVANDDLTPDLVLVLSRAAGGVLDAAGGEFIVGRDTRLSGPMLEAAAVAGLCSAGANVRVAGVVPTPAVAFLTTARVARGGAVISASHNPIADNGIKFFSQQGAKIAPELEERIEELSEAGARDLPRGGEVGSVQRLEDAPQRYIEHLLGTLEADLRDLRVVLDCAYGAAYDIAPAVFAQAGAEVVALHAEPDGARINVNCGSTSLDELARAVVREGAQLGIAFDGDADRALAVDETGAPVDGDKILGLTALRLHEQGQLKNDLVVATVMSNLGLRRALEAAGIEVAAAPVGDRFVVEEMLQRGAVLGGEQSGHIVFADHAATGDGVLTGLQVAQSVVTSGQPLSRLASFFDPYPQVLINVRVASRDGLASAERVWQEVASIEDELGDSGRVLLRPSGTEPVVRVMVEAEDGSVAERAARRIAEAVETQLS